MARKPSPTIVGVFILGSALLVVAAVMIWGSGRLFERRYNFVCYFPGSVRGLKEGSAVRFRGVPIGQVTGMRIRYEQPPNDTRIPVFIELSGKRLREFGVEREPRQMLAELVDAGLRARLDTESFVTGQLYVDLDLFPGTPIEVVHKQRGYPEIPTIPAPLEEATKSLSGLLAQLRHTDLAGLARSLASAIQGIDHLVRTPSIAQTLTELPSTVATARKLLQNADVGLGRLGQELQSIVAVRGPVVADLQRALVDVQRAAEALRLFVQYLQRHPNALIVGKKRQ